MASPYYNMLIQIAQQELPQLQYDLEQASTVLGLQAATKRMHNILAYLVHHMAHDGYEKYVAAPAAPAIDPRSMPAVVRRPAPSHQQHVEAPVGYPPPAQHYPGLQPTQAPAQSYAAPPPSPGLPPFPMGGGAVPPPMTMGPPPSQSRVVDVFVTPNGTKVQGPGGQSATLPPGVPVDTTGLAAPAGYVPTAYGPPYGAAPAAPAPAQVPSFLARQPVEAYPQQNGPVQPAAPPVAGDVVLPQGGDMTPEVQAALGLARSNHDQPPMIDGARRISDEAPGT